MAEQLLIRAQDNHDLVTKANVAKRLDVAIKGLSADLKLRKTELIDAVIGVFRGKLSEDPVHVVSNFKLETTRTEIVGGVPVEVPDGIVQCPMKVVRRELTESELGLARSCGAEALGLTTVNRVVASCDPQQVLLYLTTHMDSVKVTPSGGSVSIALQGAGIPESAGVPGMVFRDAVMPSESFLDKVSALADEDRVRAKPFIDFVLGNMLDPALVFGNRTTAPAAG